MYFYFLIEDRSTEALIHEIMGKLTENRTDVFYDCKSFQGLGGYSKRRTPKETKTGKLMNDLPIYLRGFNRKLQSMPDSAVVVVLDNDDRNPEAFRKELYDMAAEQMISVDHVFCLAVEEMEAWLLGDETAIKTAYPLARENVLHSYIQDSICGTWEYLANAVYPGGMKQLYKERTSYVDIGAIKIEWARKIGAHMDLRNNRSPSFQSFISELTSRLPALS